MLTLDFQVVLITSCSAWYLHLEAWRQSVRKECVDVGWRKGVELSSMLFRVACLRKEEHMVGDDQ